MTHVLWVIFGVTIGAAVLHGALGIARTPDRTYLSFACIMLLLAAYVMFEAELYRATTTSEAVEALRHQLIAAHGLMAFILIFVPAYTRIKLPGWLVKTYGAALAILFITNILMPYGVWLSAEPRLLPRPSLRRLSRPALRARSPKRRLRFARRAPQRWQAAPLRPPTPDFRNQPRSWATSGRRTTAQSPMRPCRSATP